MFCNCCYTLLANPTKYSWTVELSVTQNHHISLSCEAIWKGPFVSMIPCGPSPAVTCDKAMLTVFGALQL